MDKGVRRCKEKSLFGNFPMLWKLPNIYPSVPLNPRYNLYLYLYCDCLCPTVLSGLLSTLTGVWGKL